jgi:hypothetical protein
MLTRLQRRYGMSPLMAMIVLSLVPFPVLAMVILVDCWIRPAKTVSMRPLNING